LTAMSEITAARMKRAVEATEKFEPEKISRKLTISRKNNNQSNPSIILVIPSDIYDDKDEMHQKAWRAERLRDGSILLRPQ
jgi:hypothetical protein